MVDSEVENILSEIRERVLSEQRAAQASAAAASNLTRSTLGNGGSDPVLKSKGSEASADETLALIDSYLTTTARAWDRLPPVVSNRSGTLARLELWFKRHLKRATRWYAWEQINFNAAVHHTLRELRQALVKLRSETEARRIEVEQYQAEIELQRRAIEAQIVANAAQAEARLSQLIAELRERDTHLRDEQRVCFKQLALEATEAAVLEDRARRKTEALLEELRRRVEQLDK